MTTNFPSSADNFTNPTSGSSMSSPSHAGQHADANDAIEAIETALLDGAPLKIDDTNERVGIGTTTPSTKLEVADSNPATLTLKGTNSIVTAGTEVQAIDFYQSDASGGAGVSARIVGVGNNSSGAQNLTFHTGQSGASSVAERVRIDSNGKVGIGTTNPSSLLEVSGAGFNGGQGKFVSTSSGNSVVITGVDGAGVNDVSYLVLSDQNTWGFIGLTGTAATAGDMRFFLDNGERMRIKPNGNVGIGTASPSYDLDVVGRGRFAEGNNSYIFFGPNNTWGANLYVGATDNKSTTSTAQVISTNGNLHLDPGTGNATYIGFYQQSSDINLFGKVAIGGQSPVYKLDVNGPEDTASRININSGNTANRWLMRFGRNGGLLGNGIYGNTGTAFFGTFSDVNLKTGIETISTSDALTALNALRAVDYRYLLDADDVVRKGFIAQEVEEVIPEAVERVGGGHPTTQLVLDENGDPQYESVDENGDPLVQEEPDILLNWEPITTTLVAAVQELSAIVQTLTARIEVLETA